MFSLFYASLQQDGKLFLFFPILCAVFRLIFIAVYNPYRSLKGKGPVIWHCFRYGFWWGMDFNAYVFLIPMVLLSLPGAFFRSGTIGGIPCGWQVGLFIAWCCTWLLRERCCSTSISTTSSTRL